LQSLPVYLHTCQTHLAYHDMPVSTALCRFFYFTILSLRHAVPSTPSPAGTERSVRTALNPSAHSPSRRKFRTTYLQQAAPLAHWLLLAEFSRHLSSFPPQKIYL
jgi:hypothetical protein